MNFIYNKVYKEVKYPINYLFAAHTVPINTKSSSGHLESQSASYETPASNLITINVSYITLKQLAM